MCDTHFRRATKGLVVREPKTGVVESRILRAVGFTPAVGGCPSKVFPPRSPSSCRNMRTVHVVPAAGYWVVWKSKSRWSFCATARCHAVASRECSGQALQPVRDLLDRREVTRIQVSEPLAKAAYVARTQLENQGDGCGAETVRGC